MPRPKNLKLGWTRSGTLRTGDSDIYPDRVVNEIAGRFGIEGTEDIWALKQRLETAAVSYLSWKRETTGPLPRDIQTYLQTIIDRSHELVELVEKADDRSREGRQDFNVSIRLSRYLA